MKIPDVKGLFSIARGALDPRKGPGVERKELLPGADKVELSSQGQAVQKLTAERTDAKARAAFVAELQAALSRGELKTDSRKTAEGMVADGMFDDLITGR